MDLFSKNLFALRERDRELADHIANLSACPRIARKQEPDGRATLRVNATDEDGSIKLPDLGWPLLDSISEEIATSLMVVVLGFGSGRMLSEIVNRTSSQTFILLIEPDADLFAAALHEMDFTSTIQLERVSLSVGEKPHAATLVRAEQEFTVFTLRNFTVVENPWSAPLYSAYFDEVKDKLEQLKKMGSQNIVTLSSLGWQWKENIFENLPDIINSPSISSFFGKFSGVPAVIVAAGPSLSKNAMKLIQVKGKCLIISVDTAVRPLLGCGVEPDIVVSIDSQMENHLHLEGVSLPKALYALNPVVYPKIVKEHSGLKAFMSYPEPVFEWIEELIGQRGVVRAGGSVATSAFDLAIKLDCSPIIFVGQDMAYTGGKTHAVGTNQDMLGGSLLAEMEQRGDYGEDGSENYFERPNIFGAPARSAVKMDAWRRWFELIIAHEQVTVFNATEGGIPVAGAQNISLNEACALHLNATGPIPSLDDFNVVSAIDPQASLSAVDSAISKTRDEARTIKSMCGRAIQTIKHILAETEPTGPTGNKMSSQIGKLNRLSREILEFKLFMRLNRWNIEHILDKVDETRRIDRSSNGAKEAYVTIESYHILFSEIYKIANDFEKITAKAVKSIKKLIEV
ncbi:Motility accessory factor [hydrothermal vent metagenome]|uniref:Motility accessory factor n=1 Tax=hydrothermal vent metagenome TaxID=652676 RepID=A0A3B1BZL7_9ZZZZ